MGVPVHLFLQDFYEVIRSLVVQHLESMLAAKKASLAYVYFDYKDQDRQSVRSIICNLLKQLLEQLEAVPDELLEFEEKSRKDGGRMNLTVDDCIRLIEKTYDSFDRVFFLFDALDECPEFDGDNEEIRFKMISTIKILSRSASVFMTSRSYLKTSVATQDCSIVEIRATDSDIRTFVNACIADHVRLRRMVEKDGGLQEKVENSICSRAQGM